MFFDLFESEHALEVVPELDQSPAPAYMSHYPTPGLAAAWIRKLDLRKFDYFVPVVNSYDLIFLLL